VAPRRRSNKRRTTALRRLTALFVSFMLAFTALAVRLFTVQGIEAPAYARLAVDQRKQQIVFPARRGTIFDRRGEPLAVSVDLETVYADPGLVDSPRATARRLAPVLGEEAAALEPKLVSSPPGSRFEYVARQVDPQIAKAVDALGLQGIGTRPEAKRFYPNASLASHVLGFADVDGNGIAGLELAFDDVLRGRPGRMTLEQDPSGRPLPQAAFAYVRPRPGRHLFLTIDKKLQYFTELALARAADRYRAEAATAIVMRPRTGEILALANVPSFDLNAFASAPQDTMRNRAVTDVYEPGSAYKIVTIAGALEEGIVTPMSRFVVPPSLPYADRVFHDSYFHETEIMSVAEIVEQSSNVGTIKIGLRLGGRDLDRYVRAFGFGARTGLDFPGEQPGIVLPQKRWSGSTIATVPLGQGIAVTPLQMAAAYSALANGGVWVEPQLVAGIARPGERIAAGEPPAMHRVVSPRTARTVTKMLVRVVDRGTGMAARVPGYRVAGKTGTAQEPLPGGGYGDSYVASFAGYAPARSPELMVIVTLDDPDPIWGGLTAAPAFKTIMEFCLRQLGVRPSVNAELAARALAAEEPSTLTARD
jgi:cell division protein FtsI (penicillin-binding protein 3)